MLRMFVRRATVAAMQTPPPIAQPAPPPRTVWTLETVLAAVDPIVEIVAALAALAAAVVAARALQAQVSLARVQRRHASYAALVITPALDMWPQFESDAVELLERGERDIHDHVARNAGIADTQRRSQQLVEEFKALLLPVTYRTLGAANAWGDAAHSEAVNRVIDELQDDVTLTCLRLHTGQIVEPSPTSLARVGVARVLGCIVHYEFEPVTQGRFARLLRHTPAHPGPPTA